jgi:hypothetical protein
MFDHGLDVDLEVDPTVLGDAELSRRLEELCALADRVEVARLAVLGTWESRAVWAVDGAPNGAAWLGARGRLSRAQAGGMVRTARRLRTMPATASALGDGRLGPAKARLLAHAINERTEAAFTRDEELLVSQAAALTVDQTATMMRFWAIRADADGADDDSMDDHAADGAHLSQTWRGRWRLDANLDTECGAMVASVLGAIGDELHHAAKRAGEPTLSAARLRAAALVEMARRASGATSRAQARPLVWVVADLGDLERRAGAATLVDAGPITAEAARRLACDADVARVLTGPDSAIIDLGMSQRLASPTQHRLLAIRDKGCVFPGCDRPPGWCHAHHIVHWTNDGPTDLANLCLLCSHHHHLVHEGHHGLSVSADGAFSFTRPDGTPLVAPTIAA